MAYYNANRVIKLTRKALGLTQEKLSEGICEVENYSRIETGHRTIRRSTYQKLMEKMGRITDRRYAVCVSKDGMLLDEKVELERAFKRYDYEAAEKYLRILKEKADDNLLTRQYIMRMETLVEFHRGRMTINEVVDRYDKAIRMTVPQYKEYIEQERVFPFLKEELLLMMNMGNAYRRATKWEESLQIYNAILRCLDADYLGVPDDIAFRITVCNNMSMVYEKVGRNKDAIKEIQKCIDLAQKSDYGHLMPALLSAEAHNIVKLVKKEQLEKDCVEVAKKLSQRAYYIAAARGEVWAMESIKKYYYNKIEKQ